MEVIKCLFLVDTVNGTVLVLLVLLVGLLTTIDDTSNQNDLVAWVVLDGEGESAVGLDLVLSLLDLVLTELVLTILVVLVVVLAVHVILVVLSLLLVLLGQLLLDLFLDVLIGLTLVVGRSDALFGDLDGGLVDELVQVDLFARLLLLLLLVVDVGEVSLVVVESVLDTLLLQGLFGVQFVLGLELGQLHSHLLLLLVAVVQQFLQLLAVLDLLFLHLSQTILILGHDDVQGQFLLLGWDTDNLHLVIFVVVEQTLALDGLALFWLLVAQWEEVGDFGDLVLGKLLSPFGLQLQSVDCDHFGVVSDSIAGHNLVQLVVGLGRHQLVDLLTALLRGVFEWALFNLTTQAVLNGLLELLLRWGLLVHDDRGWHIDFSVLLAVLLARTLGLLDVVGSLQGADQSGVGLLALLVVHSSALDALDLSFGGSLGALLQSGQSDLDCGWGDNGVLVVAFLLGLFVQFSGQLAVWLFQLLQKVVVWLALLVGLLSHLSP